MNILNHCIPLFLAAAAILPGSAGAATILNADPAEGGIGYTWTVSMGAGESVTTPSVGDSSVGVWSWNDTAFAGADDMGWTHTTNWVALELTQAASLTITMGQSLTVPYLDGFRGSEYLYPSFTIWQGWDNSGSDNHVYANHGLIDWAEELTSVEGWVDNSTEHTATLTLNLEAGMYTIALGSQGPATGGLPRQGYYATFSTVPEISSLSLSALGAGTLILRRRRQVSLPSVTLP